MIFIILVATKIKLRALISNFDVLTLNNFKEHKLRI